MDTRFDPRTGGAATSATRSAASAGAPAAPTELGASQSVTQTTAPTSIQGDASRAPLPTACIAHELQLSAAGREVLLRLADVRHRRALRRRMDAAKLRFDAYTHALTQATSGHDGDGDAKADIKA